MEDAASPLHVEEVKDASPSPYTALLEKFDDIFAPPGMP